MFAEKICKSSNVVFSLSVCVEVKSKLEACVLIFRACVFLVLTSVLAIALLCKNTLDMYIGVDCLCALATLNKEILMSFMNFFEKTDQPLDFASKVQIKMLSCAT